MASDGLRWPLMASDWPLNGLIASDGPLNSPPHQVRTGHDWSAPDCPPHQSDCPPHQVRTGHDWSAPTGTAGRRGRASGAKGLCARQQPRHWRSATGRRGPVSAAAAASLPVPAAAEHRRAQRRRRARPCLGALLRALLVQDSNGPVPGMQVLITAPSPYPHRCASRTMTVTF